MGRDIGRIIEKLKRRVDSYLLDLYEQLEDLDELDDLRSELLEVDSIDTMCCYSAKEIVDILSVIAPNYNIDVNELDGIIYFYVTGKENESFRNSMRFMDLSMKLAEIKNLFEEFTQTEEKESENKRKTILEDIELYEALFDISEFGDKIVGKVESLDRYEKLFDSSFSDNEKIEIYTLLVKAHIEYLKTVQVVREEDFIKQEEDMLDEAASRVQEKMASRMNEEVKKKVLFRLDVPKETRDLISELKHFFKKYRSALDRKLENESTFDTFSNFKGDLERKDLTVADLKGCLIPSEYCLFLAFCLSKSLEDYDEVVNSEYESYELEGAKTWLDEVVKECSYYAEVLVEEENITMEDKLKRDDGIEVLFEEENPMKLVFYSTGDSDSEFEKSFKDMPFDRWSEILFLLNKLEQDNFRNASTLSKHNNSKLKYLSHGKTFITFKVLANNHILVYYVDQIDEINKKSTNIKLNAYSLTVESRISSIIVDGTSFEDGTVEYRKLMDSSKKILTALKEKTSEMGKGEYHV